MVIEMDRLPPQLVKDPPNLIRTGVCDWSVVTHTTGQQLIPDTRHFHGNRSRRLHELPRPHPVAELEPEDDSAGVLGCEIRLIQPDFSRQCELAAQRVH